MVNGNRTNIEVAPGEMLSDVLRYRLGLTGTKIGCNESECGACTVILDDQPVLSCNLPAMKVHGRSVQTIEGLAQNSGLHALQESFIKYGAVQCGFCTPGQLMMAAALLEENPDPTEDEIRQALKTTLCRCGAYPAIIRAIQASAQSIHSGEPASNPGLSVADEFINTRNQKGNTMTPKEQVALLQKKEKVRALMRKLHNIRRYCEIESREPTLDECALANRMLEQVDEIKKEIGKVS